MSSQPNQSLIDGITCLQSLASAAEPVKSRELARDLDLNHTRVNRLLRTLKSIGLATQDERRCYLPGPGIHALASQAMNSSPLYRNALQVLEGALPSPHLVAFGSLWRDKVTYLFHAAPQSSIAKGIAAYPIHDACTSSIGLVLLAEEEDESVEQRIGSERFKRLLPRLETIRRDGYILRYDEILDEYSIAVSVNSSAKAALAFSQLYDLTDEKIAQHVDELRSLAEQINLQPAS